jgi:hypothetical protein
MGKIKWLTKGEEAEITKNDDSTEIIKEGTCIKVNDEIGKINHFGWSDDFIGSLYIKKYREKKKKWSSGFDTIYIDDKYLDKIKVIDCNDVNKNNNNKNNNKKKFPPLQTRRIQGGKRRKDNKTFKRLKNNSISNKR